MSKAHDFVWINHFTQSKIIHRIPQMITIFRGKPGAAQWRTACFSHAIGDRYCKSTSIFTFPKVPKCAFTHLCALCRVLTDNYQKQLTPLEQYWPVHSIYKKFWLRTKFYCSLWRWSYSSHSSRTQYEVQLFCEGWQLVSLKDPEISVKSGHIFVCSISLITVERDVESGLAVNNLQIYVQCFISTFLLTLYLALSDAGWSGKGGCRADTLLYCCVN
jgi:hypothetical protein